MDQLIALILKVAKEQGYCFPGNKVMIFTVENEGRANETAAFRMIDIDEEWEVKRGKTAINRFLTKDERSFRQNQLIHNWQTKTKQQDKTMTCILA